MGADIIIEKALIYITVIRKAQVSHTSANRLTFKAYSKRSYLVFADSQIEIL